MANEIWKKVEGWSHYEVSNMGFALDIMTQRTRRVRHTIPQLDYWML